VGDKRISKRTLDSGETVLHHPPDEAHPEGKQVLTDRVSPLKERLEAALEDNQRRHQEIGQVHLDRIEVKRAAQAEKGLPPEKSAV
jgi:methylphosphotriester-DNA--protein-cysteine methyltransferase